jgi:hypothetical protein
MVVIAEEYSCTRKEFPVWFRGGVKKVCERP